MSDQKDFTANSLYEEAMYPRRQSRDSVKGSARIKNSGELYLPMPSSMLDVPNASITTNNAFKKEMDSVNANYLPHTHQNPAYRAYLQRARFPDITSGAVRGMTGLVRTKEPEVKLPPRIGYLEDMVNLSGESLNEFFIYCLSEVLITGNVNIVVDLDEVSDAFYLTTYTSESTIDWEYSRVSGGIDLTNVVFVESDGDDEQIVKEFSIDDDGVFKITKYVDGNASDEDVKVPSYKGKKFIDMPVFPAGSEQNIPDPNPIPILGISDIAISIYQESADLRQAHFLTCNPTLFLFGAKEKEKPSVIGSQVVVALSNPQAKAEYPKTDTSALDHIKDYIDSLFREAVSYGISLISSGSKESGEALSLRRADQGITLVKAASQVAKAIEDALKFVGKMTGGDNGVMFKPNLDFAEMNLGSQDIAALVNGWLQGAWDRDLVLDNMREAGFVKGRTNQQIKDAAETEAPEIGEE